MIEKLAEDYGQTAILGMPFKDPADAKNIKTEPTPGATLFPYTTKATEAPSYWYQGGLHSLLASGKQTGDVYCLIEQMLRQGLVTSPHVDRVADEVYYVLEGKCTFLLNDKVETFAQNGMVFIPKGFVKAMRVDSPTAKVFNLHTPSGFERLLFTLGDRAESHTLPSVDHSAKSVAGAIRTTLVNEIGLQQLAVGNPLQ